MYVHMAAEAPVSGTKAPAVLLLRSLVWLPADRTLTGGCQPGPQRGAKPQGCHTMCKQLTLLYCALEAALLPCTSIISSRTSPWGWKTCDVVQVKDFYFKI